MSDDRFDQDLRSVLLEDAPRSVPDDLRRRVEAIGVTHEVAVRAARPVWRRPVLVWAAVVAAAVVVLAVGAVRFLPDGEPGIGSDPSHGPSSAPSPSSSAVGALVACLAADLEGRILGWEGAAGSRIAEVEITNTSAGPCLVRGTPGLELVDGSGRVLIDSAAAGPSGEPHVGSTDPLFELAPDGRLVTEVQVSNYCGPAPTLPIDIALTLPSGGGRLVATPDAGVSSDEAVPPCLGSESDAVIAMNGWRR